MNDRIILAPRQHREMLELASLITDNLTRKAATRVDGWEEAERRVMVETANRWAMAHEGCQPVTVEWVRENECLAVGHVDYAYKIGLYIAERAYGVR